MIAFYILKLYYRQAVLSEPFEVQSDGFLHVAFEFFHRIARNKENGVIS